LGWRPGNPAPPSNPMLTPEHQIRRSATARHPRRTIHRSPDCVVGGRPVAGVRTIAMPTLRLSLLSARQATEVSRHPLYPVHDARPSHGQRRSLGCQTRRLSHREVPRNLLISGTRFNPWSLSPRNLGSPIDHHIRAALLRYAQVAFVPPIQIQLRKAHES